MGFLPGESFQDVAQGEEIQVEPGNCECRDAKVVRVCRAEDLVGESCTQRTMETFKGPRGVFHRGLISTCVKKQPEARERMRGNSAQLSHRAGKSICSDTE